MQFPYCWPSFSILLLPIHGLGSIVSIATGYRLDSPGIKSRWGARFSTPVQTGPGAHPASFIYSFIYCTSILLHMQHRTPCTMGTKSFPGVKSGRGVILNPHPLLVPWSRKGRAIPLLLLWAVQPVQSLSAFTFTFYLTHSLTHKFIFFVSWVNFIFVYFNCFLLTPSIIHISSLYALCETKKYGWYTKFCFH